MSMTFHFVRVMSVAGHGVISMQVSALVIIPEQYKISAEKF